MGFYDTCTNVPILNSIGPPAVNIGPPPVWPPFLQERKKRPKMASFSSLFYKEGWPGVCALLSPWEVYILLESLFPLSLSYTSCEAYLEKWGAILVRILRDWSNDTRCWFARVVACYSWSLLVPRRRGHCVSVEAHMKFVWCSREGFVHGSWSHPSRRSISSKTEACLSV